jgi:hypothetical protein
MTAQGQMASPIHSCQGLEAMQAGSNGVSAQAFAQVLFEVAHHGEKRLLVTYNLFPSVLHIGTVVNSIAQAERVLQLSAQHAAGQLRWHVHVPPPPANRALAGSCRGRMQCYESPVVCRIETFTPVFRFCRRLAAGDSCAWYCMCMYSVNPGQEHDG